MDQNRHVEPGPTQRVGNRAFIPEVRKRYQYLIEFISIDLKKFGVSPCLFETF